MLWFLGFPDAVYTLDSTYPVLFIDYSQDPKAVVDFLKIHGVTAMIIRNAPILDRFVKPITMFADQMHKSGGSMLVTLMRGDFYLPLHWSLTALGVHYTNIPENPRIPEEIVYVLSS